MKSTVLLVAVILISVCWGRVVDKRTGKDNASRKSVKTLNKGESVRLDRAKNRLVFPEQMKYDLELEVETVTVEATRVTKVRPLKTISSTGATTELNLQDKEIYLDGRGSAFAVSARVGSNGKVESKLSGRMEKDKKVSWVNGDSVFSWSVSGREDLTGDELVLDEVRTYVYSDERNIENITEPSRRRKRSVLTVDDIGSGADIIELGLVVDNAWLRGFRLWNPDEETAIEQAALYLTLLVTEMNEMFRSVKTVSEADPTIPDTDIQVYGVAMLYPEAGTEWAFVEQSLSRRGVYLNAFNGRCLFLDQKCGNAFDGFRIWLINSLRGGAFSFTWDHFAYITGYDLYGSDNRLLGVTNADYVCTSATNQHMSSSINEDLVFDVANNLDGKKMVSANSCWQSDTVQCTNGGSDNTCGRKLRSVSYGTPCAGPESTTKKYVCVQGRCEEEEEVCDGWSTNASVNTDGRCDCTLIKSNRKRQCCSGSSAGSCCIGCTSGGSGCIAV